VNVGVSTEIHPEQVGQCLLVWAQETDEKWQPGCKQKL
jgi:hypothetical protein